MGCSVVLRKATWCLPISPGVPESVNLGDLAWIYLITLYVHCTYGAGYTCVSQFEANSLGKMYMY